MCIYKAMTESCRGHQNHHRIADQQGGLQAELLVLVLALLITSSLLSVVVELLEPLLWLNVLVSPSVTQMLGWWVLVFLLVGEMTDSFVLLLALLKSVVSSLSFLVVA